MKSTDKKYIIFKAAVKVIAEQGLNHFSMNNVCQEAKISKGGFIYHFPSKEHLLEELNYYIYDFSKHLFEEAIKKYDSYTEAYIQSCLNGFESEEMRAYVALPNYYPDTNYADLWKSYYEEVRRKLEREIDPEWVSVVMLFTDGFWLKISANNHSTEELRRSSNFLLQQIDKKIKTKSE